MTHMPRCEVTTQGLVRALSRAGVRLNSMEVYDSVGSTNTELVNHVVKLQAQSLFGGFGAPEKWEAPSLLVANSQTGGKGRSGRTWETQRSTSLTFSLHLSLDVPADRVTWLPLIVGTAVANALNEFDVQARVKWPNDVVLATREDAVDGWLGLRKLGGVLIERVGATSFVVGVGLNVVQSKEQLPVPWATSLKLAGAEIDDPHTVLARVVQHILQYTEEWERTGGQVQGAEIGSKIENLSVTLGSHVTVLLAGETSLTGQVTDLGRQGELIVSDSSGKTHSILVGDVHHLRLR